MNSNVIVRAMNGEPACRVAVGQGNGLVYVARADLIPAVQAGEISAVGFPEEDVFEFAEEGWRALEAEWRVAEETRPETWKGLRRYRA